MEDNAQQVLNEVTFSNRTIEGEWKPSTCACKHGTDNHYFMKNGINQVIVRCLQCVPGSRCIG
jgi:hypothetical protein